ncbi:MAG: class I SAM-dependent methyltransferase [Myxococcota bacterium]|nr:class I SAM-dependent methyltransferase [Myxococcota bacterium]
MTERLDPEKVPEYFRDPGTVEEWWDPDTGPLAFHYDAEVAVLDDHLGVDASWKVLDVGTGRGRFGIHLAKQGCEVAAVDINPDMIEVAEDAARRAGVEDRFSVRKGDAERLGEVTEGNFDLVMCMELFDHLPHLDRALSSMRSVLKPGGRFAFTYVPSESLYGRAGNLYRTLRRRFRPEEMMISRTYSFKEVELSLRSGGFKLDRHFGVGVLCLNAQTRLFREGLLSRATVGLAQMEARRWPYHEHPFWGRRGAHVVGLASPL